MLMAGRRGDGAGMRPLGTGDDVGLRRAFGRFGAEGARLRGAEVVRRHQQQARWFFCDCRPDQTRPPVLVPVAESHVRRHGEEPWASHTPACDFFTGRSRTGRLGSRLRLLARLVGYPGASRNTGLQNLKRHEYTKTIDG